jgi:aminoglycoside phosphotransferase (APT) family kinase protein
MLDHIDGRYPDLRSDADAQIIADTLAEQARELTPAPQSIEVPTLSERTERWARRWEAIADEPVRYLPTWAVEEFDALYARVQVLPHRLTTSTLCHLDIREDNLLIRPDGSAVILDWGRAHRAPTWADLTLLAGQLPAESAGRALRTWIPSAERATAIDLLLTFAGQAAWWAQQPPPPGLPNLPAFCRQDADHLLELLQLLLV